MKIGRLPERNAMQVELNKWYFGVEILKYREMYHFEGFAFKPEFLFIFCKVIDYGEPYKIDGKPMKKIGGWKRFEFPFGIQINII